MTRYLHPLTEFLFDCTKRTETNPVLPDFRRNSSANSNNASTSATATGRQAGRRTAWTSRVSLEPPSAAPSTRTTTTGGGRTRRAREQSTRSGRSTGERRTTSTGGSRSAAQPGGTRPTRPTALTRNSSCFRITRRKVVIRSGSYVCEQLACFVSLRV